MASTKTFVKLGIFVVLGLLAAVAAAFVLGIRAMRADSVEYHTYFDESVQGLDVGAAVKYRGVAIGTVSGTEIAPDRRHVDVTLALKVADLQRLGLLESVDPLEREPAQFPIPPDLRAQLASVGLTGVKFVNIDFFDPKTNPIRPLPFTPDKNTIPAAASLQKSVEENLTHALERLPAVLEEAVAVLSRIDAMFDAIQKEHVVESLAKALVGLEGTLSEVRRTVASVDRQRIPEKTAKAIEGLDAAALKLGRLLDRLDGDAGFLASATRAANSIGDLGRSVGGSSHELERTLRDLGEAAQSVRDLADAIERDPDMLLRGRAPGRGQ